MIIFDKAEIFAGNLFKIQEMQSKYFAYIGKLNGVISPELWRISEGYLFHDLLVVGVQSDFFRKRVVLEIEEKYAKEVGVNAFWIYEGVVETLILNDPNGPFAGVSALGRILYAEPYVIDKEHMSHMLLFECGTEIRIKFRVLDGFRTCNSPHPESGE